MSKKPKLPEEVISQESWDLIEEHVFVPFEYSPLEREYIVSPLYLDSRDTLAFYPRSKKFTYIALKLDEGLDVEKHALVRVFNSSYLIIYEFRKAAKPMGVLFHVLKGFQLTRVQPESLFLVSREKITDADQHLLDVYHNRSVRIYGRTGRGVKVPDITAVTRWQFDDGEADEEDSE